MSPRRSRPWMRFLLLSLATLMASCEACRKKPPTTHVEPDPPPPERVEVDSVSPSSMDEGALTDVTIAGERFETGAAVEFGGYRAGNVTVVDGGTIRATAPAALPPGSHDVRVANRDGNSGTLRSGFTVRARSQAECSLQRVYFGYDKSDLDGSSRAVLEGNARCIQQRGYTRVVIEGHADERGETDYNLALGQRRADSVRRYLVDLGVGSGVLSTLSYGEEKPVDTGAGEDAWAKNRRAELVAGR